MTITRFTGSLAALALVPLTACSATTTSKPTPQAATCTPSATGNPLDAPTLTSQSVDAALAAQLPSADRGKTLTIGVAPDLPPVNFASGGQQRGLEPDLLRAAAQRAGVTVTFRMLTNPLSAYTAGQLDGLAGFLSDTRERQKIGTFVDYLNDSISAVVQDCNPKGVHATNDLCGKRVVAAVGTVQLGQLTDKTTPGSLLGLCATAGRPAPIPVTANTSVAAVTALSAGRADAMVVDGPIASGAVEQSGGKLTVAYTDTLQNSPIGVVLSPKYAALAPVLAKAYQAMVNDGSYRRILQSYGTTVGLLQTITVNGGTS